MQKENFTEKHIRKPRTPWKCLDLWLPAAVARSQPEGRAVLTDTGHQVMKDVLGEQGVFQPTEVKLQDACYGIHVMVILIPSQGVLS